MDITTLEDLITSVRDLTEEDRKAYEVSGPSVWPEIKNISARHHRIAQLLAAGRMQTEVARIVGCTDGTVSRLVASPAFQALVKQYQDEAFDHELCTTEYMETVSLDGLSKIHEKIMTDQLSGKELIQATMDLFDRTGRGPLKKVESTHRGYLTRRDILQIKAEITQEAKGGGAGMGGGNLPEGAPIYELECIAESRTEVREEGTGRDEQADEPASALSLDRV